MFPELAGSGRNHPCSEESLKEEGWGNGCILPWLQKPFCRESCVSNTVKCSKPAHCIFGRISRRVRDEREMDVHHLREQSLALSSRWLGQEKDGGEDEDEEPKPYSGGVVRRELAPFPGELISTL